jgi:hypothetical protein
VRRCRVASIAFVFLFVTVLIVWSLVRPRDRM